MTSRLLAFSPGWIWGLFTEVATLEKGCTQKGLCRILSSPRHNPMRDNHLECIILRGSPAPMVMVF